MRSGIGKAEGIADMESIVEIIMYSRKKSEGDSFAGLRLPAL